MNKIWIIRIILGIIDILILYILFKINRAIKRERRIARYSLNMNKEEELSIFDQAIKHYQNFTSKYQNNKLLNNRSSKYQKYLRIGETKSPVNFIFSKLLIAICFVLLVIISYAIQGKIIPFITLIITFILGYYLYDFYLIYTSKRKNTKIKNDILRAVIIMNNAFKAGKSTLQAVKIASQELPNPIRLEFSKIYQDMSYGLSVDVAFNRFAKRVNLEEANYIASSLTILNKTGGNIVMVFNSIERTLFDKKKLESDLKNSTAASNLVVRVLMIIPILFVSVIYLISPTYFTPLYTSTLGIIILLVIVLMFIIYIYLLNRIRKVKV